MTCFRLWTVNRILLVTSAMEQVDFCTDMDCMDARPIAKAAVRVVDTRPLKANSSH